MKHLRTDPFGTAAIIHPFVSKPLTTVLFTVLYPLPNFFHINWTPSFMNGCAEPNQGTDNCSLAPFFHNKVCTRCFLGKKKCLTGLFIYLCIYALFKDQFCLFLSAGPLAVLPELSETNTCASNVIWATSFSMLVWSPASLLVCKPLSFLHTLVNISVSVQAETSLLCH